MLSDFGKRAKIRTVCTGQKLRSAATGSRCSEPVVRAIANDGRLPAFTRPPPPRLPAADWEITTALRPSTRRLRVRPPPEPTRSPATVPMEDAHLCLHQERLTSPSGLPQRVRLSHAGREEEQQWLQHGPPQQHRPAVDFGQRLAGGDDKHSQPNAKLANGRQVCMRCARPSTRRRAGPWAPETGAAQQEQPPRHGSSYCRRRTNTVRSHPHLLSICISSS